MGRWQDAVADLSKALGLVPEKTALWHEYAYRQSFLLAYIGESERYGRLCQQVLADFSDTTDAYLAERTVKMCLFSKDIRVDLQQAGELADRAYTTGTTLEWLEPYLVLSKGIADFRRNDLDSAIPILETVAERFRQTTWADPTPSYLAMAYTRLGQPEKAQQALEAADRVISRLPAPEADEFPAWNDWMVVQIVRREAEEVVKQVAQ
jgi:tetratricopeptide (TPR) repeat protein